MTDPKDLLLGAHTSAAGGVFNALIEGQKIGATTIQLFTNNQRQWKARPLGPDVVTEWKRVKEETGIREVMSHDSYLINLGAPDAENLIKSREAFEQEIHRCHALDITYLNFHPGAALKEGVERCLDCIVESILLFKPLLAKGNTRLLLENTAGQGSAVGWKFEEIAYILDRVRNEVKIGVCVDTCHLFAAGYDIRTPEACEKTFAEFDRVIGLDWLYAMHVNDSKKPLGSRVDRHDDLGKGEIGIACFEWLMTNPRTRPLPKYLETPSGADNPEAWKKEISMLREFAARSKYAHKN